MAYQYLLLGLALPRWCVTVAIGLRLDRPRRLVIPHRAGSSTDPVRVSTGGPMRVNGGRRGRLGLPQIAILRLE